MRRVITVKLSLIVCIALVTFVEAQQQKPTITSRTGTAFRVPPDSLREMIRTADAVVRVRVAGHTPRDLPIGNSGSTRPVTVFRAKVINVIHAYGAHGVAPDEITIVKTGGDRDRGTYIEHTVEDQFPALEPGHEYVLFLTWNSALNEWVPAFGPDSVWDITRQRVESPGTAKITREYQGRSAVDALEQLRKAGKP